MVAIVTPGRHPELLHPQPTSPRVIGKSRGLETSRLNMTQDSGYGTQSTPSPDGKAGPSTRNSSLNSNSIVNQAGTAPGSQPPSSVVFPVPGLAQFDKNVDDNTYQHFLQVHRRIEAPLLSYIQSKLPGRTHRPISVRLMVIGRSEDDSEPSIVVLCPEQQVKTVRKFFEKSSVKRLCQPGSKSLPSFNVHVVGRPPQPKDGQDDYDILIPNHIEGSSRPTRLLDTYCGAPIIIRHPSGMEKKCTLGGIIKTVSTDGDVKLYGLTIGHVLSDGREANGESNHEILDSSTRVASPSDWGLELSDSDDDFSNDDTSDVDANDEVIEQETEKTRSIYGKKLEEEHDPSAAIATFTAWACPKLDKLGTVSAVSRCLHSVTYDGKEPFRGAYYDWNLIDLQSYRPNLIRPRPRLDSKTDYYSPASFKPGELKALSFNPLKNRQRQAVVIVSGSHGLKNGWLSPLPSRLLLSPGQKFIDTLIVNLQSGQEIVDGDSGSWVVNPKTLEVYGYIVAMDAFGGGYIVPIEDAFKDIAEKLQAHSVELATTIDMAIDKLKTFSVLDPSAPTFVPGTLQQHHAQDAPFSSLAMPESQVNKRHEFIEGGNFVDSTIPASYFSGRYNLIDFIREPPPPDYISIPSTFEFDLGSIDLDDDHEARGKWRQLKEKLKKMNPVKPASPFGEVRTKLQLIEPAFTARTTEGTRYMAISDPMENYALGPAADWAVSSYNATRPLQPSPQRGPRKGSIPGHTRAAPSDTLSADVVLAVAPTKAVPRIEYDYSNHSLRLWKYIPPISPPQSPPSRASSEGKLLHVSTPAQISCVELPSDPAAYIELPMPPLSGPMTPESIVEHRIGIINQRIKTTARILQSAPGPPPFSAPQTLPFSTFHSARPGPILTTPLPRRPDFSALPAGRSSLKKTTSVVAKSQARPFLGQVLSNDRPPEVGIKPPGEKTEPSPKSISYNYVAPSILTVKRGLWLQGRKFFFDWNSLSIDDAGRKLVGNDDAVPWTSDDRDVSPPMTVSPPLPSDSSRKDNLEKDSEGDVYEPYSGARRRSSRSLLRMSSVELHAHYENFHRADRASDIAHDILLNPERVEFEFQGQEHDQKLSFASLVHNQMLFFSELERQLEGIGRQRKPRPSLGWTGVPDPMQNSDAQPPKHVARASHTSSIELEVMDHHLRDGSRGSNKSTQYGANSADSPVAVPDAVGIWAPFQHA